MVGTSSGEEGFITFRKSIISTVFVAVSFVAPLRGIPQDLEVTRSESYLHFLMGSLASLSGDSKSALEQYQFASHFDSDSSFLLLKQAEENVNLGEIAEAKQILEKIGKAETSNPDYHLLLARTNSQEMDVDGSLKALETASHLYLKQKNYSKARETILTKVALLADYKRYPEAVTSLQKYLKVEPDDEIAYYFLGRIHSLFQNRQSAIKAYRKAIEERPGFLAATKALGTQLELEGQAEEALKVYQRALVLNATDEELLQKLINLSLIADDYKSALEYLKQYNQVRPDDLQNQMRAALIQFKLKSYDDAQAAFETLLKTEDAPRDRILFYLANVYEEKGETQKAVDHYQMIGGSSDYYVEAQLQVSLLVSETLNLPQKALESLRLAVTQRPESPELQLALATQHEKMGQLTEGIRALTQASDQFKDHEKIYFTLGSFLDRAGDVEGAIEKMKRVLEINPNNAHALNHIGYSYADRKINLPEAERLLKKAVQLEPNNGFILDSLGWTYFQMGQMKKAVSILVRANQLNPDQPVILEHWADALEKQGKRQQALAIYRRIVKSSASANEKVDQIPGTSEDKMVQDRVRTKLAQLDSAEPN